MGSLGLGGENPGVDGGWRTAVLMGRQWWLRLRLRLPMTVPTMRTRVIERGVMPHLLSEELHLFSQPVHLLLKRMPVVMVALLRAPVRQLQLERHHLLLEPLVIHLESSCDFL
jgi:hypothetical protein